jgi:hypothetical protein
VAVKIQPPRMTTGVWATAIGAVVAVATPRVASVASERKREFDMIGGGLGRRGPDQGGQNNCSDPVDLSDALDAAGVDLASADRDRDVS